MLRIRTEPRPNWRKDVESKGLLFHTLDGEPYWDESAYYLFESAEIDQIEQATGQLDAMCLEAVEHVIEDHRLGEFDIPEFYHAYVERSWEQDEHTIYGRFDLAFDGVNPPKMLEYNADTPTALLEAAVIQWFWFKELLQPLGPGDRSQFDQFNSLHERLIEAWGRIGREMGRNLAFGALSDSVEDVMTVSYLRDTAVQAGLKTTPIAVNKIGWNDRRRTFTDLNERPIEILFKLYPWEWMLNEPFGRYLPECPTRWLEPPWKMILSNKAILPILSELFPESPYLLEAGFEPLDSSYVSKPFHSREGANVSIVKDGQTLDETSGEYGEGPRIYQAYHPLPRFEGRHAVVGSWMVNGYPCGIGIREDSGPITRNTSRFVPHLFRKSPKAKPPLMGQPPAPDWEQGSSPPMNDPLWDRWLDR
jgi:glutathionylspermidine synthase